MTSTLRVIVLAGFVAASALSPEPAAAADMASPRLSLEPGQETIQTLLLGWINGGAHPRTKQIDLTLRLRVLDRPIAVGGVWLEVTGTRLKYVETGAKRSWPDYDSTTAAGPPPPHLPYEGTAFTALYGQTVQVAFDAEGRPRDLDRWQAAFESMIASFRTMETVSEQEVARRRDEFPEYILKSVFGILRPSLPGQPVQVGDSWSDRRSGEQGTADLTYTLEEIRGEDLVLRVAGPVRSQFGGGSSFTGHSLLGRSTAWISEADLRMEGQGSFAHTIQVVTDRAWRESSD